LRIVHVVLGGDIAGGQIVALQLAHAARQAGHEALFVSPTAGPFLDRARDEGFATHVVPIRSSLDVRAVRRLRRLFGSERADLVHTHAMIEVNVVTRTASRLASVPVVAHMHIENHLPAGRARRAVVRRLDNVTARLCARIVAVSADTRAALVRQGYPASRLLVVHNGVDLPAETSDAPGAGIVEVARLADVKGQRELIGAVARIDGATLTLVGRDLEHDGAYERELRALAERLGVAGRVELAGHRDDAKELMAAAAVVALPSHAEGLPMTLLEAMARGRAGVATAVGGTPEVVVDGETGLLVAPGDVDGLAAALERLLRDPGLRARLGRAGRERVAERFTVERTTAAVLALYAEVVRRESA
jgi:glycosyltransferase involved in cell wall biosynthesis